MNKLLGAFVLTLFTYLGISFVGGQREHSRYMSQVIPYANNLLQRAATSDATDYNFIKKTHLEACAFGPAFFGGENAKPFAPDDCIKLMHKARPNLINARNYVDESGL